MRDVIGCGAGLAGLTLLICLSSAGCAGHERARVAYYEMVEAEGAVEEQLTAHALGQRKQLMRRVARDVTQMTRTIVTLQRHRDSAELERFEAFVRPYLADRLDPLLRGQSQVWHPELRPFEANLLLAKAGVFVQLGDERALGRTLTMLQRDFIDLGSLLVEYPMGEKATLSQSIAALEKEKKTL